MPGSTLFDTLSADVDAMSPGAARATAEHVIGAVATGCGLHPDALPIARTSTGGVVALPSQDAQFVVWGEEPAGGGAEAR